LKTIPLSGRVEKDGTLDLKVQTGLKESDADVVVTIRPQTKSGRWPEGFIEETHGCLADRPIKGPPELSFEIREVFD
jgi:hypothetical protein